MSAYRESVVSCEYGRGVYEGCYGTATTRVYHGAKSPHVCEACAEWLCVEAPAADYVRDPSDAIALAVCSYDDDAKAWLDKVGGHYLQNASPGALFAIGVWASGWGLVPGRFPVGPLLGLCVVGRPVARRLPQDHSVGEVTRMVLVPGLPHGTASRVLRVAADVARGRGVGVLLAYHDRTRHTGCIYRKAGFRRDGGTPAKPRGWASRTGRTSGDYAPAPKRRWRLDLKASS